VNIKQVEAELLTEGASLLEQYKPAIEAATGPVILNVVNGAVKIAEGVFDKLPFGLGGLLDNALAGYVSEYEPELPTLEGKGIDELAALLKSIASKISGS
jgi:hypothetical protein